MSLAPEIDDLLELRHGARAVGLAAHHRVRSVLSGLYASVFRGQGMEFEETREYRDGDEIRNMDWRVTARTGVPHLKVFREERERAVMLCVDTGPHMRFGTRGTFKSIQAARAAALLGWTASSNHDRVGALLFGDPASPLRFFQPSRARQALWRMLRALTEQGASGAPAPGSFTDALEKLSVASPTGALIFVVADLNRDPAALQAPLGRLRQRHEVALLPVDDPADRDLPDVGRVVFQGDQGQRVEVDTSDPAGRRAYEEAWHRRRRALEGLTTRLGIPLIPLATEQAVRQTLVEGLSRQARRRGALR